MAAAKTKIKNAAKRPAATPAPAAAAAQPVETPATAAVETPEVVGLGPPPPAELAYVEKLASDLVGQLGTQLAAQGHPSPVLLWGLAAAARVVETTLLHELEKAKAEQPEQSTQLEAEWVRILQRREQYEQHAGEQARAAFEVKS